MSRFKDITLDLKQKAPQAESTGYTRAVRVSLQNEGYVKFRESVIKRIIKAPLSLTSKVTSYKPTEMTEKSNFFNVIANWSHASNQINAWLHTHYVDTVFSMVEVVEQDDPQNAGQKIQTINEIGDLFKNWHALTLDQVYHSCETLYKYSTDTTESQNLNISWEFLMTNIDSNLQAAVLSEISRFMDQNPDVAQSGPMAFHVIAHRIIRASDALAHNVVTGIMTMGLIHFKGEDVIECVAVLRNVLLFLGYGTARSKCPPTIMDTLVDIFLRCSNSTFVNFVRNLKDFHESSIAAPEQLFSEVQAYYNDLVMKPNGWLRTTKNRAAFLASLPEMNFAPEALVTETPPHIPSVDGNPASTTPETDRNGNVIDRTPPKDGKTSRSRPDGTTEYWCAKCPKGGRWGNHDSAHHDEWYKKFLERKEKFKAKREAKQQGGTNDDSAPSMRRATVCGPVANEGSKADSRQFANGASLDDGYFSDTSF